MRKTERTPEESATTSCHLVLPPDTNSLGTLFGGRIMEWMDITAAIAAGRHVGGPVVTLSVDSILFAKPIRLADVVTLKACVNYAGRTSLEVGVRVEREDPHNENREHCLTGYFTFVAVGPDGKPVAAPTLRPTNAQENRRYERAQIRRQKRLQEASDSTSNIKNDDV